MRKFLVVGLALAAVPVGIAFAQSDGLKVTGGGQSVLSEDATGPGDTIAFNAQQTSDVATGEPASFPAKGQLQVIDRDDAGGGQGAKFHGIVRCIKEFTRDESDGLNGTYVRFGGFQKVKGKQTTTAFTVDAQDNGEGVNALGADMILFRNRGTETANPCDDEEFVSALRAPQLYRGNVQNHNED